MIFDQMKTLLNLSKNRKFLKQVKASLKNQPKLCSRQEELKPEYRVIRDIELLLESLFRGIANHKSLKQS
jgi:hypothetical protein